MSVDPGERLRTILEVYEAVGRDGSRPVGGLAFPTGAALARELGYPDAELAALPSGALDSFVGAAALANEVAAPGPGWVLDLGCGAGIDALILSGRGHRVLALDAAPSMLRRLRAASGEIPAVQALLPALPVADRVASHVLLNGVANLVADRSRLLAETFRVLRPGGQLLAADLLALGDVPPEVRDLPEAWAWCIGGAGSPEDWEAGLRAAGYAEVRVEVLEEILPFGRGVLRAKRPL